MGDGWETKRSRQKGHKDWAIIKLYVPDPDLALIHHLLLTLIDANLTSHSVAMPGIYLMQRSTRHTTRGTSRNHANCTRSQAKSSTRPRSRRTSGRSSCRARSLGPTDSTTSNSKMLTASRSHTSG